MNSNIPWELYHTFLGVLNEGSLSGAARALGITQPTVGRHITALEKSLKLVLFTRSQAGLLATEAALALRVHAQAMASTAAALERSAASQGDGVRGVVRITASEVVGVEVLPGIIAGLRARHPDLKVELTLSNKVQDLLQREADIAVRMTAPQQEQLIARHVGQIELGLFASERYVAQHGVPESMAALAQHAVIGYDQMTAYVRSASKAASWFKRELFSLRADSDLAQLALIRCGAGIGICQTPLAQRAPALLRILPDQFSMQLDTWITMHEDLRNSPRCRVTFDALVAGMLQHASGEEAA